MYYINYSMIFDLLFSCEIDILSALCSLQNEREERSIVSCFELSRPRPKLIDRASKTELNQCV